MDLLEREALTAELGDLLAAAAAGRGAVAAVGGEAGVGKSALVRAFTTTVPDGTAVRAGFCDALGAPRAPTGTRSSPPSSACSAPGRR